MRRNVELHLGPAKSHARCGQVVQIRSGHKLVKPNRPGRCRRLPFARPEKIHRSRTNHLVKGLRDRPAFGLSYRDKKAELPIIYLDRPGSVCDPFICNAFELFSIFRTYQQAGHLYALSHHPKCRAHRLTNRLTESLIVVHRLLRPCAVRSLVVTTGSGSVHPTSFDARPRTKNRRRNHRHRGRPANRAGGVSRTKPSLSNGICYRGVNL